MARTAKQIAAQKKASLVSARKRRKRGLNSLSKKDISGSIVMNGTVRVSANRTKGAVNGSDKERAKKYSARKALTGRRR